MNVRIMGISTIVSIILLILPGCSKDDQTTGNSEIANVYVAGYEQNGGINQAAIWQKGVTVNLGTAGKNSVAKAVFVSGKDVYVAGHESISTETDAKRLIKLWKNGVPVAITDGSRDAVVADLYVVGNDVYILGNEFNGSLHVAKIWKNGIASVLTDVSKEGIANAITVSAGNVYATGSEADNGMQIVKLWKNGVSEDLTDVVKSAEANALFVSNGDVYVAGEEQGKAKFWKKGKATIVSEKAKATGIYVSGNDVYVIFEQYNAETKKWQGKLWKNGQISNVSDGTQDCHLVNIVIDNNTIYIAGSEGDGSLEKAKVWKNGIATTIGKQNSAALDIALAEQ
ncbi:hypothetical protein [Flavobacterium hibisci]|uniref:hypothetical protein n=1 Tax=Flavobacterium hibisci TaxID=1914462 RepID=UPI001CC1568F|nr:hypothetical protein [Flavobacterium hibisci]MBZ4041373.1 hypothetical protein [Flavobacterium hibisci]